MASGSWAGKLRERERADEADFLPPWVRHEHLARYELAARRVQGRDVVDCACGDGTGSERYARAGARSVVAVDLSWAHWLSTSAAGRPGVRFCAADAQSLPLRDDCADVVISLETIEHLPNADLFLAECVRVLRDDGLLVCSTPDRYVYSPGIGADDPPWNRFHLHEFTAEEFTALAGRYFGDVEEFGQNPQSRLLCRWLDRLGGLLPAPGAVRLRQAMKLPRLLFDRPRHHRVVEAEPGRLYEYRVVTCRRPRRAS